MHDIEPTLPLGVPPPVCDDEFGDTYGIVYGFTADGFTHRQLRDYVEDIRSRLLQVPDVAKVNLIGAQPERIYIQFSPAKLAGYGLTPAALMAALQAQNIVVPSGDITTERGNNQTAGQRSTQVREGHSRRQLRRGRHGSSDWPTSPRCVREDADPPEPIFRINGKPGLGLAISMQDGGDVLALGRNIEQTMQELKANLPIGIEPIMVANQPETVSKSINEFMEALWESIAIVLAVSVVSLGLRAGAIVIVSIPLVLAVVFGAMQALGIDLQRISLGALIISLGLLVDDAMITIESMVFRLERGDNKQQAAVFAYASTAYPRLTGTLVTIAGFLPVGLARSDAGEYTFSLFAVVALALLVLLGGLRPVCTGCRPGAAAPPKASAWRDPGRADAPVPALPVGGDAGQVDHHRGHGCPVRRGARRHPSCAGAVLSRFRPPRASGGFETAGQRLDPGDTRRCRAGRPIARGRPGYRAFLHLCRPGRHPLLSADRRRLAQRLLRPVCRGDQGAQAA